MVAKRHYRKHPDRLLAKQEGRVYFMPSSPCKNGHIALTRVDNYRCTKCFEENAIEPSMVDGYVSRKDALSKGETKYFLGKPCKNGHISQRWTSSGSCCQCTLEKSRSSERKSYLERYLSCPEKKELDANRKKSWANKKYQTPEGKVSSAMRTFIWRMAYDRIGKRTEKILGYSKSEFKNHIESLFSNGMSWDNHGEWHIDHIRPISDFMANGIFDPAVVNALSNLQPLWASENLSKGAKVDKEDDYVD